MTCLDTSTALSGVQSSDPLVYVVNQGMTGRGLLSGGWDPQVLCALEEGLAVRCIHASYYTTT